ncbi:2-dehydropantoate 2-reductase [Candidatus Chloroploca asiatica]|uniref:2-dehydropantoate 2-reductase n=1 Tax=Candidatus Chloroploca asiatica TaxID=1506545 RepID=A0A2H3KTU1_9CHLR|nr:2-dehydropantoate 2-reductase [Candidatus Chloroploca asiatica]PDV97282.1 2-dehydropantoate 2-reductase [Candidatus Chloroploca asiatica]
MRIAIVGVGGVGGYFGGRLAQAGHEVHFIARGAHLAAIREHGLRVASFLGDFTIQPVHATDNPADVGPVDYVLVGVKSWQLAEAATSMRPLLGPTTAVVPLLNGIEASDTLAEILGPDHAMDGLCRILASIGGPGLIKHSGIEPSLAFGERDNRCTPRAEALAAAFKAAGIRASVPPDIQVATWEKFMLICTWSGLGAITRAPIGVWRAAPGTRAIAEAVLTEVVAVGQARGVALNMERVATVMNFIDEMPAAGTSSMQRDMMEGRPSELEAQNGAIVHLGAAAGVPTPTNNFIYHCLLPQELAARRAL